MKAKDFFVEKWKLFGVVVADKEVCVHLYDKAKETEQQSLNYFVKNLRFTRQEKT
jgi:hypothetical protein